MSASAADPRLSAEQRLRPRAADFATALRLRLIAFAGLGGLAAWTFANMEIHPPGRRLALMLAATLAGAGALARTEAIGPSHRALAVRLVVVVFTAWVTCRLAGVSARLLWPWHWAQFAGRLDRGFTGLAGELWPYRGEDPAARLTLLLAVPAVLLTSGTLAFWPGKRHAARRSLALGLLLVMFTTAAVNQPHAGWVGRGAVLLLALALWLWLPGMEAGRRLRALAWLAAAGTAGALVVAWLGPARPWLQFSHWDPLGPSLPPTSFQWDQLYGPITWARSQEPMFEVTGSGPLLWKVTSLDRFDGIRFLRSAHPPGPVGAGPPAPLANTRLSFTLRGLRTRLLVGAGEVVSAELAAGPEARAALLAPDATVALAGAPLLPGDRYGVSAYVPHATVTQLRRAPRGYPAAYLPYVSFEVPTRAQSGLLPADLIGAARAGPDPARTAVVSGAGRGRSARLLAHSPYARMRRLALRLSVDASTPYDVATQTASFLRRNYVYDERAPRRQYPLESFLFGDGIGYCQQFSGAMALLLRMDGIPARVAVGFLPGLYDAATHRYRISARDAHSWVEVYFSGIGWVAFDPTPPRPSDATSISLPAFDDSGVAASFAVIGEHISQAPRHRVTPAPRREPLALHPVPRGHSVSATTVVGITLLTLLGAGAGGLVLLAGIASVRVRRGLLGDTGAAVTELQRALERLGHGVSPGVTLRQLADRLSATHGPEGASYLRQLSERRYRGAADNPPPSLAARRALRRALTSHGGALAQLRGLLALPPVLSARRSSSSRATSSAGRGRRR